MVDEWSAPFRGPQRPWYPMTRPRLRLRPRAGQGGGEHVAESLVQVTVDGFELEHHDAQLLSSEYRGKDGEGVVPGVGQHVVAQDVLDRLQLPRRRLRA